MKRWIYLILFCLISCAPTARRPAASDREHYHFVFDIDWTLVAEVKPPASAGQRLVQVAGKDYFVNHGVESLIEKLSQNPEIKISFFSGGSRERNHELLKKIKLKNGKTLFEVAYKILNFEDLTEMPGTSEHSRFVDRYKKDLSKVTDQIDRIIMFDDTSGFALPGKARQQEQVFFLGEAYLSFEHFEDTRGLSGQYIPPSKEAWLLDRQKLVILERAYDKVLERYQSGNTNQLLSSLMKAEESRLDFKSHRWNAYSLQFWNHSKSTQAPCSDLMRAFLY